MSVGNALALFGAALLGVAVLAPSLRSEREGVADGNDAGVSAAARVKRPSATDPVTAPFPRQLQRGPDGHFYADAQVNGTSVRFIVDTGASIVVLTREDARRAGLQLPVERAVAMGVGGPVEIAPVTIDRLAVGGIEARGIQGAVAEDLPVSLLGQSYLQRVASVEIRGDVMVLR